MLTGGPKPPKETRAARLKRLQSERTRRHRQRANLGLFCARIELDALGLSWLVKINALSEADADNPKTVAKTAGRAVTELIRVSAMADLD